MEYLTHDGQTVTIKLDRDELIELQQIAGTVAQEYNSLDVEILNLSRDEVRTINQKLLVVADHYRRGPA